MSEMEEPGQEPANEPGEPLDDAGVEDLPEETEPPAEAPLLQACPNCATLIDITEQEPFEQIHCPICGTSMRARTQIRNFKLEAVLGAGGMGAVYKAVDLNLNRVVALKVVRKEFSSDAEYLEKFEREALITASVNHPHVVKVFSFGEDHGLFYIAMELVDKGSLDDLMNLQGRVAEAQVLEVGIQIAEGLNAAHERGLIHRDVKPGNILFADAHIAKIVDFGLALLMEHEAESRGEVWGTPYYVAPEKLNHEPEDFRSDIYSLGGTLFHALAGRPPFEAETASLVALKHIKSQAVSLQAFAPDVTSATAYVINRMLHKEPDQRYQSYEELVEHLQYARTQLLENAGTPRKKTRVVMEGGHQQKVMAWITMALLAIVLIVGGLLFAFRERLFHKPEELAAAREQKAAASAEAKYNAARKQLAAGDAEAAYQVLKGIGDDSMDPLLQPLRSWVAYHEGLSALVANHVPEAAAAFQKLRDRGPFATEGADRPLADFFVQIGGLLGQNAPIPAQAAAKYGAPSYQAAAPLAFGLKDWQLDSLEQAAVLLKKFINVNPAQPFDFLGEYKPLAQRYLADYDAYRRIADQIRAAKTPTQAADVLPALQKARNEAQTKGKIEAKFQELEAALKQKLAASEEEERRMAERHGREMQIIAPAQANFAALCADYRFAEARAAVAKLTVADPQAAREKAALLQKAEWLVKFKELLSNDINTTGYIGSLTRRRGGRVEGTARVATEDRLQIQTPYGFIPLNWADLEPSTVLAMSTYFRKRAGQADPNRTWLCGVFASVLGLRRDGRALMVEASQSKEEYRNQLTLFIDSAEGKAEQEMTKSE